MPDRRTTPRGVDTALTAQASGSSLGIVVGLAAEARISRRLSGMVATGGGSAGGARLAALHLADAGVTALLSFGFAGGLDPSLGGGFVMVPHAVLAGGQLLPTDPSLCRLLGGPTPHVLLGGEHVVATPAEKQALWRTTGCAAVDLESAAVAKVATDKNLPFAVLRAVCDPAERTIPRAALAGVGARGVLAPGRVLVSLARHPGQLAALLALARDAARARHALLQHLARTAPRGAFATPE